MALIDLLNKQGWERSDLGYTSAELEKDLKPQVVSKVRILFRHYYLSLSLNGFFLLVTVGLYFLRPIPDMLLPVGIITSVFGFLIVSVVRQLVAQERIDTTQNVRQVIESSLAYNAQINANVCRYHSVISTLSAIGGYLLGLILQGWTLHKLLDKPIVLVVMLLVAFAGYYLTKSRGFRKYNRALNPHYFKAKKYLEEQLRVLDSQD
ncbi:MAG: hypothetical protein AAGA85_02810 [Bacteroidota bacterium]